MASGAVPGSASGQARGPAPRATFPRSRRLSHDREYQAVFGAKVRVSKGCLTVFVLPNGRPFHRMGLSIGKRAGGAVVRTRLKRMLREAFRHLRHELPFAATSGGAGQVGLDFVVTAHKHGALTLEHYQSLLVACATQAARAGTRSTRQ